MKNKFYRFFWVEHPTFMILAIIMITLGYGMAKKPVPDHCKIQKSFLVFCYCLINDIGSSSLAFQGRYQQAVVSGNVTNLKSEVQKVGQSDL